MASGKKLIHKINVMHNGEEAPESAYLSLIKTAVIEALRYEEVDLLCVVDILLTDDEGIRAYNRKYRSKDISTDVLSFPMQEFEDAGWDSRSKFELDIETGELPLGDIIISTESALRQAKDYGNSKEYETAYLIIHSMLHLLGYDHDNVENEKVMHSKTKQIIKETGLSTDDK